MAQDIIDKFILPNSEYELSIDNNISNRILEIFEEYKTLEEEHFLYIDEFENSDFINIFDDAYEEVLTNLYLNTYLKYIKQGLKYKK